MTELAVVDVETTGLNPYAHDRIIEIAALVVALDGTVVREFVTLINPERDIGPTRIHGLRTRDVLGAPRFSEIAAVLADVLSGSVALVGHNIRFDQSFLTAEYERIGYSFPGNQTLCTMQMAGGCNLAAACADHGIRFDGRAHAARDDAFATAQLLAALLQRNPGLQRDVSGWPIIAWPEPPRSLVRLVARDAPAANASERPSYLRKLLARVQQLPHAGDVEDSAVLAYNALLDRVLEDRIVDDEEGQALVGLALRWNLSVEQIKRANQEYLLRLGMAALADGVVTEAEHEDLKQVALLLGEDSQNLGEVLEMAARRIAEAQDDCSAAEAPCGERFQGKRVCFSGECQCRLDGQPITRSTANELASRAGMVVANSVTKKLDILVVADPLTQSGKAKKARQYGTRMIHELVFWRGLGLEVE